MRTKFKDFLLREEMMTLTLDQGLDYIKQHCQRFLSDIRGTEHWLYRGMNIPAVDSVLVMDHIKERFSKDSSPAYNVFFNAGIEFAFDISMIRAKTVFANGDKAEVHPYGNTFFMFPQGDYKYIWSPSIVDSYVHDDELMNQFISELGHKTTIAPRTMANIFTEIYLRSSQNIARAVLNIKTNDQLVEEAFSKHDIHVTAEDVERALRKTFDKVYFKNQDITEALEKGVEVMVYDSDGNYFVPRDLVIETMRKDDKYDGWSPEEYLQQYFFPDA